MADNTAIEWADASWNPIRARDRETGRIGWFCTHASEGCRHCYAEALNRRLGTGVDYRAQDLADIEIFLDEKILEQPLHWRRPRRIFTLSMSDLFGEFVTDAMIDRMFAVMALAPQHTFQVLTKRAKRTREWFAAFGADHWLPERLQEAGNFIPAPHLADDSEPPEWPLPNVWLGVSVEDQANADARIPELLATPAARRFISAEPLLGPIDLRGWEFDGRGKGFPTDETGPGLDWVIAGGESGPGARPMHPDWARSLRDQCQAAGVAFFFKQWGEHWPAEIDHVGDDGEIWRTQHDGIPRWGIEEFTMHLAQEPEPVQFERVGKKAAGRLLDGRTWSEFPA